MSKCPLSIYVHPKIDADRYIKGSARFMQALAEAYLSRDDSAGHKRAASQALSARYLMNYKIAAR